MKVAILGSGNGALTMAFEWSRAGHDVYMFDFPQFDRQIKAINRLGGGVMLATLPSGKNDMVYNLLKPVHQCVEKAKNIFQTCLQNANPMLHPCITTLNVARIEGPGDFFFYEDGVTPGVGRLLKAIDDERIKLGAALGLEIESDPHLSLLQGYLTEENYDHGFAKPRRCRLNPATSTSCSR